MVNHSVAEALFICCLIGLCAGVYYQKIACINRRLCVLSGDCVDSVTARDDFFRLFLNCERFKVPTILEYDNLRQIRAFIYLVVGVCGDLLNVGLEGGLGHQGDRPLVHEESATPPSLRVKTVRDLNSIFAVLIQLVYVSF